MVLHYSSTFISPIKYHSTFISGAHGTCHNATVAGIVFHLKCICTVVSLLVLLYWLSNFSTPSCCSHYYMVFQVTFSAISPLCQYGRTCQRKSIFPPSLFCTFLDTSVTFRLGGGTLGPISSLLRCLRVSSFFGTLGVINLVVSFSSFLSSNLEGSWNDREAGLLVIVLLTNRAHTTCTMHNYRIKNMGGNIRTCIYIQCKVCVYVISIYNALLKKVLRYMWVLNIWTLNILLVHLNSNHIKMQFYIFSIYTFHESSPLSMVTNSVRALSLFLMSIPLPFGRSYSLSVLNGSLASVVFLELALSWNGLGAVGGRRNMHKMKHYIKATKRYEWIM